MSRNRLLWRLFLSYLLVTFVSLLAIGWYASASLRGLYTAEIDADLEVRARLAEAPVREALLGGAPGAVDRLCKELGRKTARSGQGPATDTRFTVVLPSGQVAGDSVEDPAHMDNHSDRPEIRQALAGPRGASSRYSHTVRRDMRYVAIPLLDNGVLLAVVRASMSSAFIDEALRLIYMHMALAGLAIGLLAAAVSLAISRTISHPLEEMKRGAERFARGELRHKLAVPDSDEIGGLAQTLNQMAAQLDQRISDIVRQRNELDAVLSSMTEGVVAVDMDERVISANHTAARWLGVDPAQAKGRPLREIARNIDLLRFVENVLSKGQPAQGEIVLRGETAEQRLVVNGAALHDREGRNIGGLLVLNDITRLQRLETVRRDFVANVSHELRTPITSIKGFVETLLGGAMSDPADARRFLDIIARQADRLDAIIKDLLSLARLEQESEKGGVPLAEAPLRDTLASAIEVCQLKARDKNIAVELACDPAISARINAALLEQAIVNLVDNAITYSEPGGAVQVSAEMADAGAFIRVRDRGCGIPEEHLPRLFERFYRVDRARSRKLGGTGLGLAIVKHIVAAHGGEVSVESQPGRGSVFTIRLPGAHRA